MYIIFSFPISLFLPMYTKTWKKKEIKKNISIYKRGQNTKKYNNNNNKINGKKIGEKHSENQR